MNILHRSSPQHSPPLKGYNKCIKNSGNPDTQQEDSLWLAPIPRLETGGSQHGFDRKVLCISGTDDKALSNRTRMEVHRQWVTAS
jgi:hypothetical protein